MSDHVLSSARTFKAIMQSLYTLFYSKKGNALFINYNIIVVITNVLEILDI